MALTKARNRMIETSLVNVLDFGADPTGVTECSSNIQAAIDHAATLGVAGTKTGPSQGSTVYFPSGKYSLSTSLNMPDGTASAATFVSLRGEGKTSILYWSGGNSDAILEYEEGNDEYASIVENLAFEVPSATNDVVGIKTSQGGNGSVNLCIRNNYFLRTSYALDCYSETDQIQFMKNYVLLFEDGGIRMQGIASNFQIRDNHFRMGVGWCIQHLGIGANILISGNTMQAALNGFKGIQLDSVGNFRVQSNYYENNVASDPSDGPFLDLINCHTGLVSQNNTTGSCGDPVMNVDADCYSINFGSNYHGVSGAAPTTLLDIASGAEQITVVGQQYKSSGQTATIVTGSPDIDFGWDHPSFGSYIKTTKSVSSNRAFSNIAATSTATIGQTTDYPAMLICLKNTTDNYIYIGIYWGGILTDIAKTNANLEVQISGTDINAYNGTGSTKTVEWFINIL